MKKIFIPVVVIIALVSVSYIYLWSSLTDGYARKNEFIGLKPSFSLTNMNGQPKTLQDYKGKRILIAFGYTNCVDICPVTLASMSDTIETLKEQGITDFKGLFVSVDPERDTAEMLRDVIKDVHSDSVMGLTGTAQQIADVTKAFNITYYKYGKFKNDYNMMHTSNIFVLDENGKFLTYYAHTTAPKTAIKILKKRFDF